MNRDRVLTFGLFMVAAAAVAFALFGNRLSKIAAFSWLALP